MYRITFVHVYEQTWFLIVFRVYCCIISHNAINISRRIDNYTEYRLNLDLYNTHTPKLSYTRQVYERVYS